MDAGSVCGATSGSQTAHWQSTGAEVREGEVREGEGGRGRGRGRERERETRDRLHQSLSCVQTCGDAECSSCNDSAQVLRLHSGLQM